VNKGSVTQSNCQHPQPDAEYKTRAVILAEVQPTDHGKNKSWPYSTPTMNIKPDTEKPCRERTMFIFIPEISQHFCIHHINSQTPSTRSLDRILRPMNHRSMSQLPVNSDRNRSLGIHAQAERTSVVAVIFRLQHK
jgi:hypothetical protein